MKLARREVPLPSQEGKKGAMQYALYVLSYNYFPALLHMGRMAGFNFGKLV
jgi:hypothetical protein